jgi:hypothetical protein
MDWFAINDTELRQFNMAGLIAGGGDSVLPVVNEIRGRKISYTSEAEKPTTNKQRVPCGFRKSECTNKGSVINGKWVCSNHQ